MRPLTPIPVFICLVFHSSGAAGEEPAGLRGGECRHDRELDFCIRPNSPNQMEGFFEARGFPTSALAAIAGDCFITIGIENRSDRIVWLEPARWDIRSASGPLERITPAMWNERWEKLDLPARNRATFSWTLLPESRDLRPSEPVGGNIVLPRDSGPFSLTARFATGGDRTGKPIVITYEEVRCAQDDPASLP